jgi:ubiquilin
MPNITPEMMQQAMQFMQGNPGFGGGFGGFGAPAAAPADNRPPEEVYAEQLRQLNDMGFFDFDRNVQALRRSGGSVQGAIEHLLNSP